MDLLRWCSNVLWLWCAVWTLAEGSVGNLTIGGMVRGSLDREGSRVYTLTVDEDYGEPHPAIRLSISSDDATSLRPIQVAVQQENAVTSMRVPFIENGTQYQYVSRTLCPFSNRPFNFTTGPVEIQVTLSTSSADLLNFTLQAVIVDQFYLKLNSSLEVVVNPATPALFFFNFPEDVPIDQVRLLLEAPRRMCTIIHVQDFNPANNECPSEVTSGTLSFQGEYQTMQTQAVVLKRRADTPSSFFISIIVTIANRCDSRSADLLTVFRQSMDDSSAVGGVKCNQYCNTSNITLTVSPGLSAMEYAIPMAVTIMVYLIFYFLALGVIVAGAPRALLEAIFSCNLFGTVTHVKDSVGEEEEVMLDGTGEEEKAILDGPAASNEDEEEKTATAIEDVDGLFTKSPVKQPSEAIEMQVFGRSGDLEDTIEQSTSLSPKPFDMQPQSSSSLTRPFTRRLSTLGRQHTSASESTASFKPSVLDVLTGRHHDVRDRSASITRRETTSSVGSTRSRTLSWKEKRDQFARSKTLDHRERPQTSQLRHAHSIATADKQRPEGFRGFRRTTSSSEGDKESVQSPSVTQSLPIGIPYNPRAVASSSPLSSPTRSYMNPTPLDPIKEDSTLPRPPKDSKKEPTTSPETLVEEEEPSPPHRQPSPPPRQPSPLLEESLVTNRPSSPSKQEFTGARPVQSSVPHPLSLYQRQHSYSESVMEHPGHRDPSMGDRDRASSFSQVLESDPQTQRRSSFGRTFSQDETRSSFSRQRSKIDEATTPLLRGDDEGKIPGDDDDVPSSDKDTEKESPELLHSGSVLTESHPKQSEISTATTLESGRYSMSPEATSEGRSSSTQPMVKKEENGEYDPGECTTEEKMSKVAITLADLDFPEGKMAQRSSNRFLWQLIGLSLFYMLPAYQLVIAYLQFLEISGNQDLCYYNDRCSWPLGLLRSFNSLWSHTGYVILGLLLVIVVYRAKYTYRVHEREVNEVPGKSKEEKEGVPQYFGIYFALAFVMIAQGLLSAAYHICPNQATYQFDTTFLYIMAGLTILRIYQSRHPDSAPSASFAFITFSIIIVYAFTGTLYADMVFYGVWFAIYMVVTVGLGIPFYFRGRVFSREMCAAKLRHPSRPGNVPKFVFCIIFVILNFGIGIYGLVAQPDFGSHLLAVFISNFAYYMLYHIITNCVKHGRPAVLMIVYFIVAILFWIPAIYFFLRRESNWTLSPSLSRELNRDCLFWGFYSAHNLWHFLSAFALFFSMLAIMNLDTKQRHRQRKEIYLF